VRQSLRWVLLAIVMLIAGIAAWHYVPLGELLQSGRAFVQAQSGKLL